MVADATLIKRWPDHLVAQISSGNFVLVVGAGVSANCTNNAGHSPPGWRRLILDLAADLLTPAPKKEVKELVDEGRYLEAAELLKARARKAGKVPDLAQKICQMTDGGPSVDEQFKPSALHASLMNLEPGVIITTNYDKILERASQNGYSVHFPEAGSFGHNVRSGSPSIVKVHGSVDDPEGLILTRSDYAALRVKAAKVLEVVQALFMTRTVLFVGYGLGDPDIQLLLENVMGARGGNPSHYLLASKSLPEYQRDIYEYCYGTSTITYASGDYAEMAQMVKLLVDLVQAAKVALVP